MLAIARQDLGRVVRQAVGDPRIERASPARRTTSAARSTPPSSCWTEASRATLAIIIANGISSALRAPQRALPVPALGGVGEEAVHGARQAEPLGEHLSHLAQRHQMRPALTRRLREPPRDLDRARRRRAVRIRERAHDAGQHLALRSEDDRPEARRQVTAEHLGGDLRVRGAAAVGEQAGVVGLRRRRESIPRRSPSRIAICVACRPCSNGKPMARSVARQSAATTSAVRTRSGPTDGSSGTWRPYYRAMSAWSGARPRLPAASTIPTARRQ